MGADVYLIVLSQGFSNQGPGTMTGGVLKGLQKQEQTIHKIYFRAATVNMCPEDINEIY